MRKTLFLLVLLIFFLPFPVTRAAFLPPTSLFADLDAREELLGNKIAALESEFSRQKNNLVQAIKNYFNAVPLGGLEAQERAERIDRYAKLLRDRLAGRLIAWWAAGSKPGGLDLAVLAAEEIKAAVARLTRINQDLREAELLLKVFGYTRAAAVFFGNYFFIEGGELRMVVGWSRRIEGKVGEAFSYPNRALYDPTGRLVEYHKYFLTKAQFIERVKYLNRWLIGAVGIKMGKNDLPSPL